MPDERVILGLSGGVDSSVAALLLLEQGYQVEGVFMKNWEEDDSDGYCAAAEDLGFAERVCERLNVPLDTVNLSAEYWSEVFEPFLEDYARGRTPNPDVLCNREIKFRAFIEHALEHVGGDWVATGHYARVRRDEHRVRLLKGVDADKDQSYFLHAIAGDALARTLFPVGELTKGEVRALARKAGLAPHDKKDSTGICFIGERPFRDFLKRYLPPRPGDIETVEGVVVGRHQGLMYHTLGQRRGLGIGGRRGRSGAPWYVVGKDPVRNVLVVAQGHDHELLYSRSLHASALCWMGGEAPQLPLRCHAKTRYRQPDQACRVLPSQAEGVRIEFDRPQRAVAPGQFVVLYQGDECLGGGVIQHTATG